MPKFTLRQALGFYHRRFRGPTRGLHRTHDLATSGTIPANIFSLAMRNSWVTFSVDFTPQAGTDWSFFYGDSIRNNTIISFSSQFVTISSGGAGNRRVDSGLIDLLQPYYGKPIQVVVAFKPGTGEGRMWLNGEEKWRGQASFGSFDTEWAEPGTGGEIIAAIPPAVSRLSAYVLQIPRHFD